MRWLEVIVTGMLLCNPVWAADPIIPLKPGPGSGVTLAACSGCHGSEYIVMNSMFLSNEAWREEISKMRRTFGAPIDDATAALVATYLGENYSIPAIR